MIPGATKSLAAGMARFLARAARQSSLRGLRDLQEYTAEQQELPVRLTSLADMVQWAQNWVRVVPLQLYSYLASGVTNVCIRPTWQARARGFSATWNNHSGSRSSRPPRSATELPNLPSAESARLPAEDFLTGDQGVSPMEERVQVK